MCEQEQRKKKKSETHAFDFPDFALEVSVLCLILDVFCACRDTEGMKRAGWRGMRRGGMAGHGFRWQATGGSSRAEVNPRVLTQDHVMFLLFLAC